MATTFIFLDTNVFLHFRPFHELPWQQLVSTDDWVLAIPATVIDELDDQKDRHPRATIRERARMALRSIEHLTSDKAAGDPRVFPLRLLDDVPGEKIEEYGLLANKADHRILTAILEFRAHSGLDTVMLVTDDTGPRTMARRFGLTVLRPLDEWRLPDPSEGVEKENRSLREQLATLKIRLPELKFLAGGELDPASPDAVMNVPSPIVLAESEKDRRVTELVSLHRPVSLLTWRRGNQPPLASICSQEELARYQQECANYPEACKAYVSNALDHENNRRRKGTLFLKLVNSGSAPATDIVAHLEFPKGMRIAAATYSESSVVVDLTQPRLPRPPYPPRLDTRAPLPESNAPIAGPSIRYPQLHSHESNVDGPRLIQRSDGKTDASYTIRRVAHGLPVALDPLLIYFGTEEQVRSFAIPYSLYASELPSPVEESINVRVTRTG